MTPKRRPSLNFNICLLIIIINVIIESISNIHLMFLKGTSEKVTITYVDDESSLNCVQYNTIQYNAILFIL